MDKQPKTTAPDETPEQYQERCDQSEAQYQRDKAFSEALEDQRRREGRSWSGGF
jgi:hypothetical protein